MWITKMHMIWAAEKWQMTPVVLSWKCLKYEVYLQFQSYDNKDLCTLFP